MPKKKRNKKVQLAMWLPRKRKKRAKKGATLLATLMLGKKNATWKLHPHSIFSPSFG